ncbi:CoA-transferase family III domain-containing protein, partial [Sporodiniella umbellata]
VSQPSGTTVTGIVPTNTYTCQDGKHVIIGGNGDSIYIRLMNAIGRFDLIGDRYKTNTERVKEQKVIDSAIADWTSRHSANEVINILGNASVPAGKIYDAKDIVEDEHVNARNRIESVKVGTQEDGRGWDLKIPGMSPVLESTPGETKWCGPDLGAYTDEVLKEILNLSDKKLLEYKNTGVIE